MTGPKVAQRIQVVSNLLHVAKPVLGPWTSERFFPGAPVADFPKIFSKGDQTW